MSEPEQNTAFEFDLGDEGELLRFSSPGELQAWLDEEAGKWQWLNQAPYGNNILQNYQNFYNPTRQHIAEWNRVQSNQSQLQSVFSRLNSLFQENYKTRRILNSTAPEALWILELNQKLGPIVACGALFFILNREIPGPINNTKFVDGLIQGFLFTNEIDWTATAHHEALNKLKSQYKKNISHQDTRFNEIEQQNRTLNESFQTELTNKSASLDSLHEKQTNEFQQIIEKHENNLKAIENAYDQKLALLKPVEYWETKRRSHGRRAVAYGIVTLLVAGIISWNLVDYIHQMLSGLGQNENPRSWQIGVIVISAFFAIWLVRILVRLFLSHHHLATDADERRIMIQTYLALAREGREYSPEDMKVILDHIFRAASDGLVKDDAAPPTFLEMLTRK